MAPSGVRREGGAGHEQEPGNAWCAATLAARDVGQLAAVLRNRLKSFQYRPELIGGFLAQTGLTLEPQPP